MKLRILRGSLRGKQWLAESGGKVLRVLGGTYEPEQTRAFEELVKPGDTVLDVGAHVGYYTLLSSVLVGASGRVFAFEPNPRNYHYLDQHVYLNRCRNVTTVPLGEQRPPRPVNTFTRQQPRQVPTAHIDASGNVVPGERAD